MRKNPTIEDVASLANVSRTTVSRFINNSGYVNEKTAEDIKRAIGVLNYRPNKIAQALKSGKTNEILLIVPDISVNFYSEIYKAIQHEASHKSFNVILFSIEGVIDWKIKAIDLFHDIRADGVILSFAYDVDSLNIQNEIDNKKILIMDFKKSKEFDSIHTKFGHGNYISTKYLIESGHKKIDFVGGYADIKITERRRQGYIDALVDSGLDFDPKACYETDFSMEGGYKTAKKILDKKDRPTAVCAANDHIAIGLIMAFKEAGVSVPDDISIVGMDNIELSNLIIPKLTTVTSNGIDFGINAFEMIYERIEGIYSGPVRNREVFRNLVIRDSVKMI